MHQRVLVPVLSPSQVSLTLASGLALCWFLTNLVRKSPSICQGCCFSFPPFPRLRKDEISCRFKTETELEGQVSVFKLWGFFLWQGRGEYCTTGLSHPIYTEADPNSNRIWTEVMKYATNRIMVKANFFPSAGPNFTTLGWEQYWFQNQRLGLRSWLSYLGAMWLGCFNLNLRFLVLKER